MASKKKPEIITFKADETLADILRGIPNRSDFIRKAILAAMESVCPLCMGTGILTPEQRQHFQKFARDHSVQECSTCHASHLVCEVHAGHKPSQDIIHS
ncbi:CopG family transcriptional regulator [candidate division CSSED10-310 bacterium]|uniref:CopG family transcriptional regulator n=1 Tax=candidate division CSSED10-310 bacterium TaxID=2855610 RepID=A0ABV6YZS4_UNCC1